MKRVDREDKEPRPTTSLIPSSTTGSLSDVSDLGNFESSTWKREERGVKKESALVVRLLERETKEGSKLREDLNSHPPASHPA